jgi:hypothetical protein
MQAKLGWPSRAEILTPSGEGAKVFAQLVRSKIGRALKSPNDRVGILTANSKTLATEPPLAIVCETERRLPEAELRELQRLSWNFSRTPMLITVEPHLLRLWTCCKEPVDNLLTEYTVEEISLADLENGLSNRATRLLHWANLVSGEFFKERALEFQRERRADQTLLENLNFVKTTLKENKLIDDDVCHDLLARIIFVQFLFDRRDSSGYAALNPGKLERLYEDGVLKEKHDSFASILSKHHEAYRFFRWLDEIFNGDLFPGRDHSGAAREQAWQAEKRQVEQSHLEILSELVGGKLHLPSGQYLLWRDYSFDAIPLEFVSSILEVFVKDRARRSGIYFTPPHLVDFTLDQVLPWGGKDWDLKILDPACGSGVFLVKAFQRLVHRWKINHPEETIRAETLRGLLERNLFGVDMDSHAVRVASYNLYLAMCDEIEPRYYWNQVRFPLMRGHRLIHADFFREDHAGFQTQMDGGTYDLVVGNAPWGERSLTKEAKAWAKENGWPTAYEGIGTMFLPKAGALNKAKGKVAIIQSASALLFNRSTTAMEFRKKFFSTASVEQIVNLSAVRFKIFKKNQSVPKTVAPSCIAIFQPRSPSGEPFLYVSPKVSGNVADQSDIIVEAYDVKEIYPDEAANVPEIWTSFLWGNRRDWLLIQRLRGLSCLENEVAPKDYRRGIVFGNKKKHMPELTGRRILFASDFPENGPFHVNGDRLPKLEEPFIEGKASTDFSSFIPPQLLVKLSWRKSIGRFRARLVRSQNAEGILCTQSYLNIHVAKERQALLDAACLTYNSIFAVYFLLLTSGRFASYRPSLLVEELLRVPLPSRLSVPWDQIESLTSCDEVIMSAFDLKDAERVLIEDLFEVTLSDFKGDQMSVGRKRTDRVLNSTQEPQLWKYCEYVIKVLRSGFGHDKEISATIFQEEDESRLPFRIVAFQFDSNDSSIEIEKLESVALLNELESLNKAWLNRRQKDGSIYYRRVARIYDQRRDAPVMFIIKPDAVRYWTRSLALSDADEVTADFASWHTAASNR